MTGFMLPHDDPPRLEAQRRMALAFNLTVIWGTSEELDGRSLSVARDASIPAICTSGPRSRTHEATHAHKQAHTHACSSARLSA